MKKAMCMATVAMSAAAFLAMAQDVASKFVGTWKGNTQTRKLTLKDGVIFMEEMQANGSVILRQYPTNGQEVTMTEGVWKDSKATGHIEGNKLIVDTVQGNGTKWHDEWTMADDGKSFSAIRQNLGGGPGIGGARGGGGGQGGGGGARGGGAPAGGGAGQVGGGGAPGGGGGAGRGGRGGGAETWNKVE